MSCLIFPVVTKTHQILVICSDRYSRPSSSTIHLSPYARSVDQALLFSSSQSFIHSQAPPLISHEYSLLGSLGRHYSPHLQSHCATSTRVLKQQQKHRRRQSSATTIKRLIEYYIPLKVTLPYLHMTVIIIVYSINANPRHTILIIKHNSIPLTTTLPQFQYSSLYAANRRIQ